MFRGGLWIWNVIKTTLSPPSPASHSGLERIFHRNPSYDARPLLQGVASIIDELVRQMHVDASYLLGSLRWISDSWPLSSSAVSSSLRLKLFCE